MKRYLGLIFAIIMLMGIDGVVAKESKAPIIVINNEIVEYTEKDGKPFVDANGRTQVPLRKTLEIAGCKVGWDSDENSATVEYNEVFIEVPISKDYIIVNDAIVKNDTASIVKEGRTYLPIRVVLESLGHDVSWDSESFAVVVTLISERTWQGIYNDQLGIDELSVSQKKVDVAEKYLNETEGIYNNESSDVETQYWVSGDVVSTGDGWIIVYGQAYGFGAGMHEGYCKVYEPESYSLNYYSGSHPYIGTESMYDGSTVPAYGAPIKENRTVTYNDYVAASNALEEAKKNHEQLVEKYKWYNQNCIKDGVFYHDETVTTIDLSCGYNITAGKYGTMLERGDSSIKFVKWEMDEEEWSEIIGSSLRRVARESWTKHAELIDTESGIEAVYSISFQGENAVVIYTDNDTILQFNSTDIEIGEILGLLKYMKIYKREAVYG